ncbi:MAG: helix-turn-helix transcriptional regulator [Clostridia bacterium]|nr:helix-turn-helix transcriptional regulator [Clostridia bacterium]
MQLELGQKIRELRRRDGRTQEALAEAIGVTSQAISRWEANGGYPDMEMIPAIANYFGITIDELFGYQNNREDKIDAIIQKIEAFGIPNRGDDAWIEECLAILREGLAEFPRNERLLLALADTLSEAGWRRHNEWLYYDEEGFIQHNYDVHKTNEYWAESIKICESLVKTAKDNATVTKAIHILVLLYRNMGENEKAIAYAQKMPGLNDCRENLLVAAADGKEEVKYIGEYLLKLASQLTQKIVYGLFSNRRHFESDMPIEKIQGAIRIYDLICDDGNLGRYHGDLVELYLYLSRVQWERGYHDDAFVSLYEALKHSKALEKLWDGKEHTLTAPLVSFVTYTTGDPDSFVNDLPDFWPTWMMPDCSQVAKEIKADPRWKEWVAKTKE